METPTCPICGKQAEQGAIYGGDRTLLRWFEGEPTWKKNLATAFDTEGIAVGESNGLKGVYALGTRCRTCRKIVIDCNAL